MIFIMLICGIITLVRGEAKITRNRRVSRTKGRVLGILMLLGGVVLPLLVRGDAAQYLPIATAFLTFFVGLAIADKSDGQGVSLSATSRKDSPRNKIILSS